MEFDKSKVYTSVNADELKIGSKVICADSIGQLEENVRLESGIQTLTNVASIFCLYRFETTDDDCEDNGEAHILAYLVEPPEEKKLKWTELKIGDVIRNKKSGLEYMVVGMSKDENENSHILIESCWIDNESLTTYWEKVE